MPMLEKSSLLMLRRIGFVILSVMFVGAAVIAIRDRGPWYDEFYSFYVVRPGVPVRALWPGWLRDNHPPLFYALVWGWSHLVTGFGLSDTIESLRTLNLAILAGVVVAFVRLARTDAWFARIAWYDCLALAVTIPALDQIDQLRSYFLSFALSALALPLLARRIRGCTGQYDSLTLGLILALAFSVHLVTTVIIGGLVAATTMQLLLTGRRADAARLTMIATLALVPFALSMAVQFSTILANTQVFWIPAGLKAARCAIELEVARALDADPVLALAALAGLASVLVGVRRHDDEARATLNLILTFGGGLALALAVLVAAHLHRPLLITRYLVALDPILALILALCAEAMARRLPLLATAALDLLILAAAGLVLQAHLAATLAQPSWNGTGSAIAAIVRVCPGTIVHADMLWNTIPRDMPPHDNHEIVPFAYRDVAHRFGFTLAPEVSHDLSRTCPTVFWTEHVAGQHPTAQAMIDGLRASGYPIASGRAKRIGSGWILITAPTG